MQHITLTYTTLVGAVIGADSLYAYILVTVK